MIAALPLQHSLAQLTALNWSDLADQVILIPRGGAGPELERILNSKVGNYGRCRLIYQECGLDHLLSLVSAEYGLLLMLEGASGVRHDSVTYREIHDGSRPTLVSFSEY